jgi:hypothetical protein
MGAVQAQDYLGALWAVGVRLRGRATEAAVQRALDDGAILRTHTLRFTWQLVAPADLRWMLALVAPRLAQRAGTRWRTLGLDAATFRRAGRALGRALADGSELSRAELAAVLHGAGVDPGGERLLHILGRAELDGILCSGARRGKQPTWALLDRRVPADARLRDRRAAAAELAGRYFRSRGPASLRDFVWWSGLTVAEARAGLEAVQGELAREEIDGTEYFHDPDLRAAPAATVELVPPFDEYLIAYRDRGDILDPRHVGRLNAGGGMIGSAIVAGGRVIGTWRRTLGRGGVAIALRTFAPVSAGTRAAIAAAARRYADFLGLAPRIRSSG